MALDLHKVLLRKQERECARADDFAFRARARTMARFARWLREHGVAADPKALAAATVTRDDAAILDELLSRHAGDRRTWTRAFHRAQVEAERELRAELGDPSPHRLA